MNPTVRIVPYGSLRKTLPLQAADSLDQPLGGAQSLAELFAVMGIADEQIQLVMVNHRAVSTDTAIQAGDRIALFPREYPIFVDWHTHRRVQDD